MWAQGLLGEFLYAEAEYVHDIRPLLRKPDGTRSWRASRPPIDIYAALQMSLPGLCAHESTIQGGKPVPIPQWRD